MITKDGSDVPIAQVQGVGDNPTNSGVMFLFLTKTAHACRANVYVGAIVDSVVEGTRVELEAFDNTDFKEMMRVAMYNLPTKVGVLNVSTAKFNPEQFLFCIIPNVTFAPLLLLGEMRPMLRAGTALWYELMYKHVPHCSMITLS